MSIFGQDGVIKDLIDRDGVDITLTEPGESPVTVRGAVFRSDVKIEPDTQTPYNDPWTSCTIPIASLTTIPAEGWSVSTTDVTGATVSGRVSSDVRIERTVGLVTLFIEATE